MEHTFHYDEVVRRAKALALAKAAGQELPKTIPPRRGKRLRSDFDVDAAIRRTREQQSRKIAEGESGF